MQLIDKGYLRKMLMYEQQYKMSKKQFNLVMKLINDAPIIDAVPIVRCKDCVHRDPEDKKCDCGLLARQGCPFPVGDNYFCGYGERKDGDYDETN